jgi:hypothetical protein
MLAQIDMRVANDLLCAWGHRIGPCRRPMGTLDAHALLGPDGEPLALTVTADLVRETVAGVPGSTRQTAIELARLCAAGPHLCRPMLRLWRELVWPSYGRRMAVSYQDADMHRGELYRHDGWRRVAWSHSGRDARSGRVGRNKWVWVYPRDAVPGV